MIVTLIETYRIFNMTLPDKVKGRFWITDVDSFGNDRKLISVEADEESWVLKGSDSAVICDTHNRIADDTVLEDNVFYNVRILEENEEGYVYAQPDDIGRQTFNKYVFRDNAELTIGRDSDNTVCINNRYVSSHHAVIKYMDGVWTIEDKIDSYINAIKLYPKRPEAYIKMLEVYTEHGFGIEESKQFMNYYNQNFSENNDNTYDKTSGQIAEMNYQAGIIYLYMYDSDENSQETFRSRALKAYPFFKEVCENNDGSYANYSLAQSYYVVCDFYKNYVDNSTSVKEPTKELYAELITAVETCITNLEDYDNPDIAYVKLTMYEAILNLIHEQRRAFMRADIEAKEILSLFEMIYRNTDNLDVLQEKSIQKKASILEQKDLFISDIESIYNEE